MILGILNETNDKRVSLLPEQAEVLTKQAITVWTEVGAGIQAFADDNSYAAKNASLKARTEILQQADLILTIHPLSSEEIMQMKSGAILVGVFQPLFHVALMKHLA